MKVSVITTTYNHKDTIARSIKSVQSQKGVEFEHIVIDDTNTNNGMMRTFQEAFNRCSGEYICFCDGDDYWISDNKIKRQVEYMDANKDCGLCITNVYTESKGLRTGMPVSADEINKNMSFDALLRGSAHIHAQSYMLRKSDFDRYVDFDKFVDKKLNVWDYPIVLELIKHKRFHCLDFYSAVFVKNTESVTQTQSRIKRLKYVLGDHRIKWYYILKYGCKPFTVLYVAYKFARDIYSIIFKRWYR
jgi:glycosyltransferase involved in cell wall biosynthesis